MGYATRVKKFRFKAFISYSHADGGWASWLQKALEGYRVPRHLVGSKGEFGPVPKRLIPVFRDREDLSSAADLSGKVKEALEASETLIVVCSPSARKSEWVNEEIRDFRELGRGDRIHAVIVDGDPTSDDPEDPRHPAGCAAPARHAAPPEDLDRVDGRCGLDRPGDDGAGGDGDHRS